MNSIRLCIVCEKEKALSDFNEEHVIPAGMGRVFIVHNVCSICNSTFGKEIDDKLLKNDFVLYYRNLFKLGRYQTSNIPNVFKGIHTLINTHFVFRGITSCFKPSRW